ncbi:MAG: YkgJ family cysteine cluster protein [Desulfobulbaceae bacterium]|nr:YkgJ family cysteine cluster protein [Desulfobulbaceae bacterium]
MTSELPEKFSDIGKQESFCFSCHPGVPCFTDCCRELDLALTPYDVLRLKNHLKLHSGAFLERYVIIEWDEQAIFPVCYLTMVDDGKASCVFVKPEGCTVYEDRPGACRAYPVGRGVSRKTEGDIAESFVLVKEDHCRGFEEKTEQTINTYFDDQELATYNRFNDKMLEIYQHPKVKAGFRPTKDQLEQYILALYNLDQFRVEMKRGRFSIKRALTEAEQRGVDGDDELLLELAIRWVRGILFNEQG